MEGISSAFAQAAGEVDESSEQLGAETRQFGVPDFSEWKKICQYGALGRSWLFSIVFFADGDPFYKTIAAPRRHTTRSTNDPFVNERDCVGLYFTGVPAHSFEQPDYTNYSDPHVRLRELIFLGDKLYRYTQEAPGESWNVNEVESTEEVVEDLFKDVFFRKAGLAA